MADSSNVSRPQVLYFLFFCWALALAAQPVWRAEDQRVIVMQDELQIRRGPRRVRHQVAKGQSPRRSASMGRRLPIPTRSVPSAWVRGGVAIVLPGFR